MDCVLKSCRALKMSFVFIIVSVSPRFSTTAPKPDERWSSTGEYQGDHISFASSVCMRTCIMGRNACSSSWSGRIHVSPLCSSVLHTYLNTFLNNLVFSCLNIWWCLVPDKLNSPINNKKITYKPELYTWKDIIRIKTGNRADRDLSNKRLLNWSWLNSWPGNRKLRLLCSISTSFHWNFHICFVINKEHKHCRKL